MQESTLEYIQKRNFLQGGEDNLARLQDRTPRLVLGAHRQPAPLVTVVIPAYKREALLRLAVESALAQQGFDDYQILVVDDTPPNEPGAEALLRGYADERLVYYRNPENLGLMDNWNTCYLLAQSEWVCTLHDDDFLPANFLQKMGEAVQRYPQMDALFNLATQFDGAALTAQRQEELAAPVPLQNTPLRRQRVWRLNFGFAAGRTTGSFIRRSAFLACGGFGPDRQPGGDVLYNDDYVLAARLFAGFACYILPQKLYNYRTGANNGSARVQDYLPDVVQEYYLGRQISARRCVLWRWLFYLGNRYRAIELAGQLNQLVAQGGARMNREAGVDLEELRRACGWRNLRCSPMGRAAWRAVWRLYSLARRALDNLQRLPYEG